MYDEMNTFARALASMLLGHEPRSVSEAEPLVALALSDFPTV
jgi:hypothetical protein